MPHRPRLTATIAGRTDAGRERDHNEDAIAWDARTGIAVLADGMGGHNAGEVASQLAVESIMGALRDTPRACPVLDAIQQANELVHAEAGKRPGHAGMGTTVAIACLEAETVTIAHVGDSRIYRLRGEDLEQLTSDHSMVQELVDSGFLSAEDAAASINRNIITRALGTEAMVQGTKTRVEAAAGDLFVLCSDGLSDPLPPAEIARLCRANDDLERTATALVDAANAAGGRDNVSVILMRLDTPPPAA